MNKIKIINFSMDYYDQALELWKKSTALIIVFPGYGYESNYPLFFYLKELMYDPG